MFRILLIHIETLKLILMDGSYYIRQCLVKWFGYEYEFTRRYYEPWMGTTIIIKVYRWEMYRMCFKLHTYVRFSAGRVFRANPSVSGTETEVPSYYMVCEVLRALFSYFIRYFISEQFHIWKNMIL